MISNSLGAICPAKEGAARSRRTHSATPSFIVVRLCCVAATVWGREFPCCQIRSRLMRQRGVLLFLLCCATSAQPMCPQSPSAGSHPYCCGRSYATCLASWPASPCGAGGGWGGHRLTVNRITGGLRCQRSAPLHSLASALSASHICCSVR